MKKICTQEDSAIAENDESREPISIDMIKSDGFRFHYANGVWVSTNAEGMLCLAFFHARETIPSRLEVRVTGDDDLDEDESVEMTRRADEVRELETGVLMTVQTAQELRSWLDEILDSGTDDEEGDSDASC